MIDPPGAARVWASTREFWRRARRASRPPTATSSGAWAARYSKVYPGSPAGVAASAVAGRLEHPGAIVKESEACLVEA